MSVVGTAVPLDEDEARELGLAGIETVAPNRWVAHRDLHGQLLVLGYFGPVAYFFDTAAERVLAGGALRW